MLLSFWSKDIDGSDDQLLSEYLDDVESTIGNPGIAEKVKRKYNWIRGRTSLWWLVHKEAVEKWLWQRGIKGESVFHDKSVPFDTLPELIEKYGVIVLGTKKMGGLPGGHIILAVGYTDTDIICHDPFGNANTNYKNHDGSYVQYSKNFLEKYAGKTIRCLYWRSA
jgi:hypothetical protein